MQPTDPRIVRGGGARHPRIHARLRPFTTTVVLSVHLLATKARDIHRKPWCATQPSPQRHPSHALLLRNPMVLAASGQPFFLDLRICSKAPPSLACRCCLTLYFRHASLALSLLLAVSSMSRSLILLIAAAAPLSAAFSVLPAQRRLSPKAMAPPMRSAGVSMDFGGFGKKTPVKEDAVAGEVADVPFEVRFSIGNLVSGSGALLFVFCIGKFLVSTRPSFTISAGCCCCLCTLLACACCRCVCNAASLAAALTSCHRLRCVLLLRFPRAAEQWRVRYHLHIRFRVRHPRPRRRPRPEVR